MRRLTTQQFIVSATSVHGDKYDYTKTNYITAKNKVTITCKMHGDFDQAPFNHLNGMGCRKCGFVCDEPRRKATLIQFVDKARKVHGLTYSYSKFKYTKSSEKGIITCKKHGDFLQQANAHLQGQGCPKCKVSKGERQIARLLTSHGLKFSQQVKFDDCVDVKPLPFDFAIYDTFDRLIGLIEYQGIHHYKPVNSWGGVKNYNEVLRRDNIKKEYCRYFGIKLSYVTYHDRLPYMVGLIARGFKADIERLARQGKFVLEKLES